MNGQRGEHKAGSPASENKNTGPLVKSDHQTNPCIQAHLRDIGAPFQTTAIRQAWQ